MSDRSHRKLNRTMDRRDALKTLGRAAAAGILGAAAPGLFNTKKARAQDRPNIVFILSDDHRWDHLSVMGHPFIQTPSLDRLAKEGVLFENAFVTTSLCSPSRASFLTGQYAHTHGVKNNLTPWNNENRTFLEHLKNAGYDTAFIGKWHMPGNLPKLRGVDRFVTFTAQGGQGKYFDCPLIVDGRKVNSRKSYITEELTDYGIEFIEEQRKNPFCLMLSHKAVHHQFLPPPDLDDLFKDEKVQFPSEMDPWVMMTNGNLLYGVLGLREMLYKNYCEAIVALDREIGRLLGRLDDLGLADNTIVVYAGDNGYFWGEHNLVDKRYAYEESIRIPLIVHHPQMVRNPGRKAPRMTLNVDLAPTLLDLAGLPVPNRMEGQSFAPMLESQNAPGRVAWMYEYYRDYPYRVPPHLAVRTERYKYIEFRGKKGVELYDLQKDPKEQHNLMGTPEGEKLLPEMKGWFEKLKKEHGI